MALKVALLCFQFRAIDDLLHDPALEHDFTKDLPLPGEAIQPVVLEAVARIKRCIAASVSSWFTFGQVRTTNISNFLHIATLTFNTEIGHTDGSIGQTSIVNVIKFYHLDNDEDSYRVTLDIEELYSSMINTEDESAFEGGITNEHIERLAVHLDRDFELNGKIEFMPIIKRGHLDAPYYLVSKDNRLVERTPEPEGSPPPVEDKETNGE